MWSCVGLGEVKEPAGGVVDRAALGAIHERQKTLRRLELVCGFFMHQHVACFGGGGWINRYISFVDVLNDPILIYYKCSSVAEALFFVEDPVVFHHGSFEIAEQWKGNADVLSKAAVGGNAVYTNSKNLRFCSFEFGDISLIRL